MFRVIKNVVFLQEIACLPIVSQTARITLFRPDLKIFSRTGVTGIGVFGCTDTLGRVLQWHFPVWAAKRFPHGLRRKSDQQEVRNIDDINSILRLKTE